MIEMSSDLNGYDLTARIWFISPTNGGRNTLPAQSGISRAIFYNDMDCDVIHEFVSDAPLQFASETIDHIKFIHLDHLPFMKEGLMFLIREGNRTVGYGQVISVNVKDN